MEPMTPRKLIRMLSQDFVDLDRPIEIWGFAHSVDTEDEIWTESNLGDIHVNSHHQYIDIEPKIP